MKIVKKPKIIKNETDFRHFVHATGEEHDWFVNHIESPVTSPGIPDLHMQKRRKDLWLEIKIWKQGGIFMRPPQRRWHRAREAAGGASYVMCYIDGGIYVHSGYLASSFLPRSLSWKNGDHTTLERLPSLLEGLVGRGLPKAVKGVPNHTPPPH